MLTKIVQAIGGVGFLLMITGCTSMQVLTKVELPPLQSPVFPSITVDGPVVRDFRLAGISTSYGSSIHTGNYGVNTGNNVGFASQMETYENHEYEEYLCNLLEDRGIAKKVIRGYKENAEYDLKAAQVGARIVTTGKQKALNGLNMISLACLFYVPFISEQETEVMLRLYKNGELITSSSGVGRVRSTYTLSDPTMAIKAGQESERLAIMDAIQKLVVVSSNEKISKK